MGHYKRRRKVAFVNSQPPIPKFSIKDFAIIIDPKCKENVKDFSYPESTPRQLLQSYLPDATTGFDDFSTSPPEQLVRRSSRVSGTSSQPPPKRRKKIDTPKTKVSKPNSSKQLNVPINQDKSVNPDIEELKEHLKDYVDKKFEYLEALIKTNHSQLMKSIHREDNQQPKDVADKSMSCMIEVSDQEDNDEHQTSIFKFDQQPTSPIQMDSVHKDQNIGVSDFEVENQIDDTLNNQQEMKDVLKLQSSDANIHHTAETTEHKKDSTTYGTISSGTREAIDTLIVDLGKLSIPAKSVSAVNSQELTGSHSFLSDSQLPTDISIIEIVVRSDINTPLARNRMPSKKIKSSYLTSFGSREKGKKVLEDDIRPYFLFEGCGITNQQLFYLIDEYIQWVNRGLLETHANKKPTEDKYRAKASSFGFEMMDFVVAFSIDQKWIYAMSQPKKCWTDQRLIRVYDSSLSTRKKVYSGEIKKLSRMLPSYFLDNDFFEKIERTNWEELDAYKDKEIGTLLKPYHPFNAEYAQGIMQQESDSIDLGLYVATFAEFLSDQLVIPPDGYLRNRYAALL
ncbi:hypothetical protein MTR67_013196 [Solanum verrucosum]|uniref:Ulp1 protease family, C-terminal catalytic domain containing protein n=1 Tax=Solanum verrucosum TaxID=315347 RepID=A0AAF0QFV5_SOLVR|nr:hypothetical protein MTR67_013196 [Solanum verrucosum]